MSHAFSVGKLQCWKTASNETVSVLIHHGILRYSSHGSNDPFGYLFSGCRASPRPPAPTEKVQSNSLTRAVVVDLRSRDAARTAGEISRLP